MVKFWLLCLILVIMAVSGCMDNEPEVNATMNQTPTPTPTQAFPELENTTVYVKIMGTEFIPISYNVKNGTTVKWTNEDSAQYILNVDGISSPPLNKRDSWNYTFYRTGTFEYNLSNNSKMQKGRIIVE